MKRRCTWPVRTRPLHQPLPTGGWQGSDVGKQSMHVRLSTAIATLTAAVKYAPPGAYPATLWNLAFVQVLYFQRARGIHPCRQMQSGLVSDAVRNGLILWRHYEHAEALTLLCSVDADEA